MATMVLFVTHMNVTCCFYILYICIYIFFIFHWTEALWICTWKLLCQSSYIFVCSFVIEYNIDLMASVKTCIRVCKLTWLKGKWCGHRRHHQILVPPAVPHALPAGSLCFSLSNPPPRPDHYTCQLRPRCAYRSSSQRWVCWEPLGRTRETGNHEWFIGLVFFD